ncbi:hypothetical protein [Streptacidiphilus sp. EB129]|uniref:hypothetical protein n=1 Tax=Streptacidiphilus sp. EB129 TaxID=3156262 RepID=UPI00351106A8
MNDIAPTLTPLERRLAGLRGTAPQRSLDARALAALAANPGCGRRAVLDAAGVDKTALATRLGHPAPHGQSPFAISRGLSFERRVKADACTELLELLRQRLHLPAPYGQPDDDSPIEIAELVTDRSLPAGRVARTRGALLQAWGRPGVWTLLDHPLLRLDVAGSTVHLEPDLIVVRPDGRWTVVEIKSFPILDGSADPAQVGAAARQAAVYALALRDTAADLAGVPVSGGPYEEPEGLAGAPDTAAVLVCPKDFSNRPTAAVLDVRKPMAVTRRQLARLTRIEQLLDVLPPGTDFDPARSGSELTAAVGAMPAVYSPDCLAACELSFHCREEARCAGSVDVLGRGVRGELGSLATVSAALRAAYGNGNDLDIGPVAPADHSGGASAHGDGMAHNNGNGNGTSTGTGTGTGTAHDDGDAESIARLAHAAALRSEALAPSSGAAPHPRAVGDFPAHTANPAPVRTLARTGDDA